MFVISSVVAGGPLDQDEIDGDGVRSIERTEGQTNARKTATKGINKAKLTVL